MSGELRGIPGFSIWIGLEGSPVVHVVAECEADEARLLAWARGRPRVLEVVGDALRELQADRRGEEAA